MPQKVAAVLLKQVVLLDLNRMVSYLKNHEEEYSELLAQKTTRDYDRESQNRRQCLQELIAWNKEVDIGCLSTFTRTMYPAS